MSLRQFEEAVGHWRGADGGPAETRRHGGEIVASIEAVGEFGQVAGDVLLAGGPLDGGLDVAERGVDPLEGGWPHRRAAGAGADRLMCASRIGDTAEASEAIADDGAGGGSRLRRASFSTSLRRKPSTRRSFRRTGWPSGVGLHGDNDRRLAGRAAAAFATGASATERGIVDLDPTGQAFARIPLHHHPHELVFELPGGVLGHTEAAVPEGQPVRLKLRRVDGFRRKEVEKLARRSLDPPSTVVSDGLACFRGVTDAGCTHQPIRTGSGRTAVRPPAFKWVNTALGNIKTAITAT